MLAGYLYLLVAVSAWSSYPVLARIAYGLGMTPLTLGFLRFGFALPVLLLALLLARLLLGERLLPVQVLGAALVVAGVLILGLEDYYRLRLRS
ncbi:MAG: hypothetical protein QME93_06805 [Bacillota bacterium]|nr:hypothetical protein [Bacillota bacterium]MDI7249759.1 hypothetical protein [Bacillota bacterium]